ncbi:HYR domain-containing protein [Phaeovulum sp. W22_SRMD_FR3]|uniref:HYR domain-containing protein n=1 Tax=Phaeovulum sp. W22_SRMD_FR3 TaxID=3240274 RepID=UPI003F9E3952
MGFSFTLTTATSRLAAGNHEFSLDGHSFSPAADTQPPVLTAPSAQSVSTDAGVNTAALNVTSLGSVSDNVDSGLAITYKVGSTVLSGAYDFPLGVTTVTMDATDTALNAATQASFTVTVSDAERPVLTAPSAQVANTDPGVSTASVNVTSLGSVSDNVDGGLAITYRVGSTVLSGAYDFPLGVTTVTMDATDTALNAATQASFTVTVSDAEVPVLTAPSAQSVSTDAGVNTASLDVTSLGSVSDNVDSGLAITYKVGSTVLSGAYDFPLGVTTVTMDATDTALNAATQVSFTVTVSDAEVPVLTAPSAQSVSTDAGVSTASLDVTSLGSVSDNVDSGLAITYKVGSTVLSGAYDFPLGVTTVTMDTTDTALNAATQVSFTVTVSDAGIPVLTAPANQTANTDPGVSTAALDVTSLGSVSDNVDSGLAITYKVGSTVLSGAYDFPLGVTTVTMDATDTALNAATQVSFTVTVSDAEVPVLTAPSAQSVSTDAGVNTASLDVTSLGSVSDNVDSGLAITYRVGSTVLTGAYDFPLGVTTVTMDATDTALNAATQVTFTVTVSDAGMPVLTAPADQTANTDPGVSTAALDVTSLGSVSDNVDSGLAITYRVGSTVLTGAYDFPLGVTTVTMDATDTLSNAAAQVSFTVTVSDAEAPVLTAPANQTAATDDGLSTASVDVTSLGSVSDNVDTGLAITYRVGATVLNGAYDFPLGATTVTMQATDTAGNAAVQVSFTVTISDTATDGVAPVLTAPANQTANTDDGAGYATVDVTSLGSVSDNLDTGLTITYRVGSVILTGAYDFPVGETTVTMDATDTAGNAAVQVSFTVTVQDVSPPPAPTVATVVVNLDQTLTVSGTTEPGALVTVTFPDLSVVTTHATGGITQKPQRVARNIVQSGTFSVTSAAPQPNGTVTVTSTDSNGNTSGATVAVVDTLAPDVVISGGPEAVTPNGNFTVSITFTEAVTGFGAGDIVATHASVTGLTGSGASYTASLTASGGGDIRISVPAGAAQDAAGNLTTASNLLVLADTTVAETQETIADFMFTRANQLVSNQPELSALLNGAARGHANAAVTRGYGTFEFGAGLGAVGFDNAWFQLKGAKTKDDTADSLYMFGAIGGHVQLRETMLLGAMLQFDHQSQDDGARRVKGSGWLAGPYFVARLAEHPITFEGSLLYGRSQNRVSPFGTYEDGFDTKRVLGQVKVTGAYDLRGLQLSPYLKLAYTRDAQSAYIDALGSTIPGQTITLRQIALGVDLAEHLSFDGGEMDLVAGVSGIGSSTSGTGGTGVASSVVPGYEGWRARVKLGVTYASKANGTFSAAAYVDGLGAADYDSYGLNLGYTLDF